MRKAFTKYYCDICEKEIDKLPNEYCFIECATKLSDQPVPITLRVIGTCADLDICVSCRNNIILDTAEKIKNGSLVE